MPIPWYPWYPRDFMSDKRIRSLSLADKGLLHDLFDLMWLSDDPIPSNPDYLRSLLSLKHGADARWLNSLSNIYRSTIISVRDNCLWNKRLYDEKAKAETKSTNISQAVKRTRSSSRKHLNMHLNVDPDSIKLASTAHQAHNKNLQQTENKQTNLAIAQKSFSDRPGEAEAHAYIPPVVPPGGLSSSPFRASPRSARKNDYLVGGTPDEDYGWLCVKCDSWRTGLLGKCKYCGTLMPENATHYTKHWCDKCENWELYACPASNRGEVISEQSQGNGKVED